MIYAGNGIWIKAMRKSGHRLLGGIMLLVCLANADLAMSAEIAGRVDEVVSGDTIYIVDQQAKRHKVYLLGIRAPGPKQPYSEESRAYLQRLLFARNDRVRVAIKKYTRAKNIIGTVFAAYQNSKQFADINGMMVMAGYARANRKTSRRYLAVERIARNKKIGLWQTAPPGVGKTK